MSKTVKTISALTILFVLVASALLIGYLHQTDIHGAIREGDLARIKAMLAKSPELINLRDDMDYAPIHTAAAEGHADIVRLLLEKSLHSGLVDSSLNTPLHIASARGHTEVVSILLTIKPYDHSTRNIQNNTPLHLAVNGGHLKIVQMLIEEGVKTKVKNKAGQTPLDIARARGRSDIIEVLSKHEAKE